MTDRERVADYIQRFSELIGVPIDPLDADGYTQVARGSATVGINVIEQKGFILFLAPVRVCCSSKECAPRIAGGLRPPANPRRSADGTDSPIFRSG